MWRKYNKFACGNGTGLPSNPVQAGRRSVCGDDGLDEFQLETELHRLSRQMHIMEVDKRAYGEEVGNAIRKKQAEIETLNDESKEMNKILKLATSDRNQAEDERNIGTLLALIDKLDEYKKLIREEERNMRDLDEDILNVQKLINTERKITGSVTEETLEMSIAKRLRVTENRLDQELIKFNNQLATNAKLREELDHLRQEKSVFDVIYRRLTGQLEETKLSINNSITQAAQAYEERDEAQNKMVALKERSDKDMGQQTIEMRELQRIIKHDNKLKEFMGIKVHDRADLREEEQAKKAKGKDSADKDANIEKQSILMLEEAFNRITEATGEHDINRIVSDFIKREDQNFALYNYVNELNDTVEGIEEEINSMRDEIKKFQVDDVKSEDNRRKMIREMEVKAEKLGAETEEAERKNTGVCKILDEVRSGVSKLFKEANCDSSTIHDMLGSEEGVTNKNILQYLGLIEQRTMELVKLQQYIQMKKEPPKQEKKDSKTQPTPPASQQSQRASPKHVQVAIVPPSFIDDEDIVPEDGELRPLTRNEIKSVVVRKINTKLAKGESFSKSLVKRTKVKSPTTVQ